MRHGSLFSGIGGFDLAAEWMGWENVFHCEWNEFGQKILKYYFPNAKSFSDITKSTFLEFRGTIDVLTGGFPCQPFSTAGKRQGTDDSRYLWPEMLRVIREIQPRYIVGENVRGLVNWNEGMVFDQVCTDLETEGYQVIPLLLPACGVENAPHRRDRIWFVAKKTNDNGWRSAKWKEESSFGEQWDTCSRNNEWVQANDGQTEFNASNTESSRLESEMAIKKLERKKRFKFSYEWNKWNSFPSVSPLCDGDDGLSERLDSITFSKWRKESIKGGGNAIVPQVAYQIFKAIEQN